MSSDVHRWSSTVTSGPWPAPYWTPSSPCRFFQSTSSWPSLTSIMRLETMTAAATSAVHTSTVSGAIAFHIFCILPLGRGYDLTSGQIKREHGSLLTFMPFGHMAPQVLLLEPAVAMRTSACGAGRHRCCETVVHVLFAGEISMFI